MEPTLLALPQQETRLTELRSEQSRVEEHLTATYQQGEHELEQLQMKKRVLQEQVSAIIPVLEECQRQRESALTMQQQRKTDEASFETQRQARVAKAETQRAAAITEATQLRNACQELSERCHELQV